MQRRVSCPKPETSKRPLWDLSQAPAGSVGRGAWRLLTWWGWGGGGEPAAGWRRERSHRRLLA